MFYKLDEYDIQRLSRRMRYEGVDPTIVMQSHMYIAAKYQADGRRPCWMLQRRDGMEIKLTWSELHTLLMQLDEVPFVEVYPVQAEVVFVKNARWFWEFPTPDEINLSQIGQRALPVAK